MSRRILPVLVFLLLVTGLSPLRSRLVPVRPMAEARSSSPETVPDPVIAARAYIDAWQRADLAQMYSMTAFASRTMVTEDRFIASHRLLLEETMARRLTVELRPGATQPSSSHPDAPITAKVPFRLALETELAGDYSEDNELPLVLEGGQWHVAWSPAVMLRDLVNGNQLALLPQVPQRGRILDRHGRELATQQVVPVLGVVPAHIVDEGAVLADLARFLGTSPDEIMGRYAGKPGDWWAPIETLTPDQAAAAEQLFGDTPGVQVWWRSIRTYPNGPLAAHALGYVSPLTQEELARLFHLGYRAGEYLGRAGVEEWAEDRLAGRRGGKLAVVAPDGRVVRILAERPATEGLDVVLTLDLDLQRVAEEALGDRPGSLVVMDPRDNSILALVSHPSFDPNALVRGLSQEEWEALSRDGRQPFQNRATLSAYPTGSVFKVITMIAGLEQGGYRPNSRFVCRGRWEAFGQVWGDWQPGGHGSLDLRQGLMQSCNIVFYEIGRKLDAMDQDLLPSFARQFGLGEPTGVVGLAEVAGTVPSPQWKKDNLAEAWYPGDTINLSIGQGYLEATPLQVANLYSALAADGSLRTPILVRQVLSRRGQVIEQFEASERRRLPASPENLLVVREAMKGVAGPTGTAASAFRGFPVPVAAKSGAAENPGPNTHAWLAAYAPADAPRLVVLVMVERAGFGGQVAGPIARRVLEEGLRMVQ